jgi:hypothetical protein
VELKNTVDLMMTNGSFSQWVDNFKGINSQNLL